MLLGRRCGCSRWPGSATWNEEESRKNFELSDCVSCRETRRPAGCFGIRLRKAPEAIHITMGASTGRRRTIPNSRRLPPGFGARRCAVPHPSHGKVRIIQTNSAGDNVHVIDPLTNKVVGQITGIEVGHGAAAAPDGSRIYFSNEADTTLDVVDGRTLRVTNKIPLSGHPNNIAASRDGKRVYVAIREEPGAVDVIDTVALQRVKSIPVKGAVHNTYVTPDGRYVVAGSIEGKNADGDRHADRTAGVGDGFRARRAADGVRDEPRRLDEAHVRAAHRVQWFCGGRLRDAQGSDANRAPEAWPR